VGNVLDESRTLQYGVSGQNDVEGAPQHPDVAERINPATAGMLPQAAPMILRHFYHRGLLLLSSCCYHLFVESASEFGRIVVLPHPDGLDKINSDRADARGLTASGSGMLLHRGRSSEPVPSSHYRHLTSFSEQNRSSPPWQTRVISWSCSEFSDSIAAQLSRLTVEAVAETM